MKSKNKGKRQVPIRVVGPLEESLVRMWDNPYDERWNTV